MVENRQQGITKAYRNDKKDFDTRISVNFPKSGETSVVVTV